MKLRLLLTFLLLCQSYIAFSDTFVVTSNADNGPGTLREALIKAASNGNDPLDYIYFNLPGNTEADRTIVLLKELPRVSSNLIIDGSSQPGNALGMSSAKIAIKANRYVYLPNFYTTAAFYLSGVKNVEIYGFYISDFRGLLNPSGVYYQTKPSAIFAINSENLVIGAPGKGNVFDNNELGIQIAISDDVLYAQPLSKNIKIQSNWFGLSLNGSGSVGDRLYHAHILADGYEFGGSDSSYGNTTNGYVSWGITFAGKNGKIRFNKFQSTGNGTVEAGQMKISLFLTDAEFTDNQSSRFDMDISGKNIIILRNKEYSPQIVSANIYIAHTENIQIGTDNIEDANEFLPRYTGPFINTGSKNVEIGKNIIHCTPYAYSIRDLITPEIQVRINNENEYSGTATPGSEVYIYNDNSDCPSCSPLEFYRKITSDPLGNWGITGDFRNNRFIANTTLIHTSSEFTQPHILDTYGYWYVKTDPHCGEDNGTLELTKTANILKVEWYNSNNDKVGEGMRVENLPPGQYYAKGYNGKCYTLSPYKVTLYNSEPQFTTTSLRIQQPACGENNGSIKGLFFSINGAAGFKWVDQNNHVLTTSNLDLLNVGPGSYTLIVTSVLNCTKSYGPIVLENVNGPNIDQSAPDVSASACNTSNGYIKNVVATGSGSLIYKWKNMNGEVVGNTENLINVSAGQYILEVKDDSACPALVSAPITIPEINGVNISTANKQIGKATCNTSNGRITGIIVSGASSYKWLDASGTVVSTALDLTNQPAGKYRLVASNIVCNKTSEEIIIEQAQSIKNFATTKITTPATCGLNNGRIEAIFTGDQPVSCFWKNNTGEVIGRSKILENQGAGPYDLYAIDELGCEHFLQQYSIDNLASASINRALERISNDQCGLGKGQIKAPGLSGGQQPYFYEWKDVNGRVLGSTSTLDGVKPGTYQLTIGDALACSRQTISYTVNDENSILPRPVVNDIKICAAGNAMIQVLQPANGTYLLYSHAGQIVDQNNNGIFKVNVNVSQNFSVVLRRGSCESPGANCKVTIENEGTDKFANAFSPNGDGVNDQWLLPGIQNYPEASVAIYNRYGQKVFESTGYKTAFNGRWNDKELPIGTYYYIIDLKRGCGLQKGSLTIIR